MNISEKKFFSHIHPDFKIECRDNQPGYIFYRYIEDMLVNDFGYEMFGDQRGREHVKFIRTFAYQDTKTFVIVIEHPYVRDLNRSSFKLYRVDHDTFKLGTCISHTVPDLIELIDTHINLIHEGSFSFSDDETPINEHELAQMLVNKIYSPSMKIIHNKYGAQY